MKAALAAGGTFSASVLAGFAAGLWVSRATGSALWTIAGLFAGVGLGGFVAARMLLQAGK